MSDQRKSLTEPQRHALRLLRDALNRDHTVHLAVRLARLEHAARMVAAAFPEDGDDEEPEPAPHEFPAAYHAPWEAIKPGQCYGCRGNADHDGSWHEAAAS